MGRLDGEVALVTGGGRGFGRAIAEALAREGAAVGIVARSRGQIEEAAATIEAAGGRALAVPCDVTHRAEVAEAVAAVGRRFGPVTFLVNNAGFPGPHAPIAETDPDDWWAAQRIHLYAPLLFVSAVVPGMIARGGGRIVNVASRAAIMFQPGLSAYVVGKSSQVKFTEHLDAETRDKGVRAFALQPGDAPTGFAQATLSDPDAHTHLPGMIAILGQWVQDVDPAPVLAKCADKVVEIAQGRWDRVAGQYLDVDWDWSEVKVETRRTRHD